MAEKKLEGRHVLFILIGFFTFMLIANGFFVYFALTSFSGLTTEDAYKKGLNYNAELATQREQLTRGWTPRVDIVAAGNNQVSISLALEDANGRAVDIRSVQGILVRPTVEGQDVVLEFNRNGDRLVAESVVSAPGNWDMKLYADAGNYEKAYHIEKRLWVK
ncbi:FixH family protein [Sneathiella limimaris]|uniref:FixH family protein n=1 Tax=Sneathiella limimaris TaxID=1964213 RepID=UPI00146D493A|nr:FixH family protein [Sneathiella limimaris]